VRCRVTGLRPTYGRISRFGGMALSYTMDKVGPMCREVEDCALVFAALCGADPKDPSSVSRPFDYRPRRDLRGARIGYVEGKTSIDVSKDPFLENLRRLGAELRPVKFTPVPEGMINILDVECGSAFDEFTRGELIDQLKNSPWPVTFRASRYVPAVEYLQAQRARTLLMERFERELGDLDAYVESGIGSTIVHTNLTGHPQIVIPQGDDGKGNSVARSIIGRLYKEDRLLQIARLAQEGSDFHRQHPRL